MSVSRPPAIAPQPPDWAGVGAPKVPVNQRATRGWIVETAGKQVKLTNLPKVYWPDQGYTKGDLLAYYFNVADAILPHLAERTLTLKRMPDGIAGIALSPRGSPTSFFERHPPKNTP